ncbi:leucine-rich repeat protein [Faecalibacterium sp. IP-3-29]|uniref:leucine-rich repeat protein n=1 Tax=Faecalibacterium sp. IP-3-29 TaxID=2929489 RepID=UPI002112A1CB|nr:leucine-rich repeat protein [Faecalibacterium sp. IP-3-29]
MLPLSAVTAFAADTSSSTVYEATVDGYKYAYTVNADGNATITDFLGPVASTSTGSYDITIPEKLDDHPVTGLGESSFSGTYSPDHPKNNTLLSFCNQIQSVTIPESVTSIGKSAFEDCSNLDSLTIKGVATSIGAYAFGSCTSLTSLSLVGSFQTIGDYAFVSCGMTSLTIDATITSIEKYAFSSRSLTSLSLTGNVQKIGDYAFYSCSSLKTVTLPKSLTSIGAYAFDSCTSLDSIEIPGTVTEIGDFAFHLSGLTSVKIDEGVQSTGVHMFYDCDNLATVNLPESLTTIAKGSFAFCSDLNHVKIPARVTCIGDGAFSHCTSLSEITLQDEVKTIGADAFLSCQELTSITLPDSVTDIGKEAFGHCSKLESITIPKNVTTIKSDTFDFCFNLKSITLPAGLTSFQDDLSTCTAGYFYATDYKKDENGDPIYGEDGQPIYIYTPNGAIYYNSNKTDADKLLANSTNTDLKNRNFLYLCNVTFDANGGNLTDSAEVPVYKTEKITDTKANELTAIHDPTRAGYKFTGWYTTPDGKPEDGKFDVDETAITKDITLYAGWEFDPDAPSCHPLTVTGGTVTVKYDGSDVTSKLNSSTDATTGQKTYSVPEGAEVTVTLDKNTAPEGKVFDGWSTSLPTGQDYKAENITFTMRSGVNVSATYRDAAADHTPGTAACHPLTVTGGIVTVKNGDKDVTDTLTVTTDETTGKKTYSVPEGATVTVTLDKTLIPEGMVFDIWSTGKFSLPLGQDYKAESITFTMNTMSSDADIAAQYRDATIEDDGPNVLGTAAIIGTAAVGGAVLGYQAYSLGTEFAGKLMALPYFPSNRSALAMMLWEDAGKPMPESELLYPDVGQEEQDMDLQHAARWAMENELIPDLNDEGTAPEEMKFFPANPVSKLDVLNAWQKAQELKNN